MLADVLTGVEIDIALTGSLAVLLRLRPGQATGIQRILAQAMKINMQLARIHVAVPGQMLPLVIDMAVVARSVIMGLGQGAAQPPVGHSMTGFAADMAADSRQGLIAQTQIPRRRRAGCRWA